MKHLLSNGYFIAAALLLVVFCLILAGTSVAAHMLSRPGEIRYVCADFTKWEEAQEVYLDKRKKAGYLDGDKDGIACKELYNKEH